MSESLPEHGVLLKRLGEAKRKLREQISKVIVGQEEAIELVLVTLLSRGHALLVGVPGLAKTLLVSTVSRSLNLSFSRIQFTPDLMPSDITGTEVIEEDRSSGKRNMRFVKGPVFAHVVLADEINRTPPKTQAALLEAMQEHQVTIAGTRHLLPEPFMVLATQNPIEQEGTYPLPEAQLDRFMLEIRIGYPSEEEELEIVRRTAMQPEIQVEAVLGAEELLELQDLVRDVPVAEHVLTYGLRIVRCSRPGTQGPAEGYVSRYLNWGAGPRASQHLVLAAKARALLSGRGRVELEDLQAVARPVLRHRLVLNFNAEAEGISSEDVVGKLLESVPAGDETAADKIALDEVLKRT